MPCIVKLGSSYRYSGLKEKAERFFGLESQHFIKSRWGFSSISMFLNMCLMQLGKMDTAGSAKQRSYSLCISVHICMFFPYLVEKHKFTLPQIKKGAVSNAAQKLISELNSQANTNPLQKLHPPDSWMNCHRNHSCWCLW